MERSSLSLGLEVAPAHTQHEVASPAKFPLHSHMSWSDATRPWLFASSRMKSHALLPARAFVSLSVFELASRVEHAYD